MSHLTTSAWDASLAKQRERHGPVPPRVRVAAEPDVLYDPDGASVGGGTWYAFRAGHGWEVDREARTVLRRAEASGETFASKKDIDDYLAVASIGHARDGAVPWNRVETHLGLPEGRALSLKTGNVVSQKASFFIRRAVTVEPDFSEPPLAWLSFLERVLPDPRLRELLRDAVAYTLTGFTDAEVSFWLFGPEASGKSTVADTLQAVLGGYSHVFPDKTMVTRGKETPASKEWANDLGSGVRFAMVDEVDSRDKLNERGFKTIVTGGSITARRLYKGYETFRPTAKLWMFGNTIPRFDVHGALTRRICAIPFSERIPEDERDESVKQRLVTDRGEHARVLAWAVERTMEKLARKAEIDAARAAAGAAYNGPIFRWVPLPDERPEASRVFLRRVQVTNDPLAYFVGSRIEPGEESDLVHVSTCRARFAEWMETIGENIQQWNQHVLNRRMGQAVLNLGGKTAQRRATEGGPRQRVWTGVRWKS